MILDTPYYVARKEEVKPSDSLYPIYNKFGKTVTRLEDIEQFIEQGNHFNELISKIEEFIDYIEIENKISIKSSKEYQNLKNCYETYS